MKRQALADLFARYARIFRHAWSQRRETDAPDLHPHEAQFLPAALALRDTPVHPAPRIALWLIMAFALIALVWAVLGRIDVVATAVGKIIPNDRTKVIQPMETAVVKAIRVRDGQVVQPGQLLIELDATSAAADSERLRSEALSSPWLRLGLRFASRTRRGDARPTFTQTYGVSCQSVRGRPGPLQSGRALPQCQQLRKCAGLGSLQRGQ